MTRIHKFVFNPFQENTYIVSDDDGTCAIIDPGCYSVHEKDELKRHIDQSGLKPVKLINTHAHLDHILGNAFVSETWNLLPELHIDDLQLLRSATLYGDLWGIKPETSPDPVSFLKEDDVITIGSSHFKILFVPGHCPGHIALYEEETGILIAGDVLFQGSIGRTDLPGGDMSTLLESIRKKFFVLPDETIVYPGHGPETTIGEEKKSNPFVY